MNSIQFGEKPAAPTMATNCCELRKKGIAQGCCPFTPAELDQFKVSASKLDDQKPFFLVQWAKDAWKWLKDLVQGFINDIKNLFHKKTDPQ